MEVIGKAHSLVHKNGIARVQTDIRAGSRTDKIQHFSEKVSKVESILANDSKSPTVFFTPSAPTIQAPTTTSRLASYSANLPWMSASMQLRRSFTPHANESKTENALADKSGSKSGSSVLSFDVRFDFNNVLQLLMAAYLIKNLFTFSMRPSGSRLSAADGRKIAESSRGSTRLFLGL